jgi:hypothetical protein
MSIAELTEKVQFVTDAEGNRQAVLDIEVWEELLRLIHECEVGWEIPLAGSSEDDRERLLARIAESREAYNTGQVRRGTAEELIAELNA